MNCENKMTALADNIDFVLFFILLYKWEFEVRFFVIHKNSIFQIGVSWVSISCFLYLIRLEEIKIHSI